MDNNICFSFPRVEAPYTIWGFNYLSMNYRYRSLYSTKIDFIIIESLKSPFFEKEKERAKL
jgi:hypothetical protein